MASRELLHSKRLKEEPMLLPILSPKSKYFCLLFRKRERKLSEAE
jgi:hypothetical protein